MCKKAELVSVLAFSLRVNLSLDRWKCEGKTKAEKKHYFWWQISAKNLFIIKIQNPL